MFRYAEVLVDVANRRLDQAYHYRIPDNLKLNSGMRVLVPLQQRQIQGLVVNLTNDIPTELRDKEIRSVLRVIDGEAVPAELIELAQWLAETTICSIAQSLHTVWPLLKGRVEEWMVPLVTAEDTDIQALKWLDSETYKNLAFLFRSKRKALPLETYLKRAGIAKADVLQLVKQGWVKTESRFVSGSSLTAKVKKEADNPNQASAEENKLEQTQPAHILTQEQRVAVEKITPALQENKIRTFLLHGITGSGKTEVYRELIARVLAEGGDVILLVPEIALTPQVASYFERQFGSEMIILHSGLQPQAKQTAWTEILSGRIRLVIGARSAVFAPLPNLRLIIIDEEHDGAYKQGENPKYHAREVARKRMEQRQGVVLLGSATPSLEAYAAAQSGKIDFLSMSNRVGSSVLPAVEIIDMREELLNGNRSIFSLSLQSKLRDRIEAGEQAMLFLNRRGYSTFVFCRECGYVVQCPNCDIALTFHNQGHSMQCHYCNHIETPPHRCPQCGSQYIRFFGQGTQRVEEEIMSLLPEARVLRLDWDTTRSQEAHRAILKRFKDQEASILVGTQMMAKGLDFPNVTLVGVIVADQTLNMPDFRARERTFQLLTQVAGRAGRSEKRGEVVIQTYSPRDRAILRASDHDFPGFFWEEIRYRQERSYPPFTHIIRVLLMHEKEEKVIKAANELTGVLRQGINNSEFGNTELNILGPAPAVMPKLKGQYRWQVSVKGKRLDILRAFLHQSVQRFFQGSASNGIVLNIEVDPLSL